MNDLGDSSTVRPPASPTSDRRHGRRVVTIGLTLTLTLMLMAGVGTFFALRVDGSSYPAAWDPAIEPFVAIVKEHRGLTFTHPVKVRFLDDDAFEKTVRTDKDDLSEEERQHSEVTASIFRAFGVLPGDVDLFEAVNDADGSGTLAHYSFEDRTITVRGTGLTLATHGTIVHELTHALQDQRFDIADQFEDLSGRSADGEATTALAALRGIVEGDAERIASLYRESLGSSERQALATAEADGTGDAWQQLGVLPDVVTALLGVPYSLGHALVETVAAHEVDQLDDLLAEPPPDDSVLLDPITVLDGTDESTAVKIPSATKGEKKVDSGQIGAVLTYLMLAERIELSEALAAADSWDGDAYIAFERDGVVCARVDYAADSFAGTQRLTSGFSAWIAADPGSSATIEHDGDRLRFESCDPGKKAELTNDAAAEAMDRIATRAFLGASMIDADAEPDYASCFAGRMVDEFSVAELSTTDFAADDPVATARIRELSGECR